MSVGQDKRNLFLLFLIVIAAFVLRFYNLGSIPPGIHGDEGEFGLFLNKILQGRYQSLFTIVDPGIFSFPVISFIPQIIIKGFFENSVVGIRAYSVIFGTMTVLAFFFLARLFFDKKISLLLSFFLATSSFHIHYSRLAVNNIYPPFFAVLSIYFFLRAWDTGRTIFYLICGLVMGVGLYSYHPFKIIPLVILFFIVIKRRNILKGLLLFITTALVFLPQIIYYFGNLGSLTSRPQTILSLKVSFFFDNLSKNILVFFIGKDDGYHMYGIQQFGLLSPLVATLFIIGILLALRYLRSDKWQLIYLAIITTIIAVSFTVSSPASHRLLVILPMIFILVGVSLELVQKFLKGVLLCTIFIFLGLFSAFSDYYIYFDYYINSNDGWAQYEPATEIAKYLKSLGPSYYTYMLREGTILYFRHGTVQFLNPGIRGEDVDDSLEVIPLRTMSIGNTVFVMPPNSPSLDKLKKLYPNGTVRNFVNPRSKESWFSSFELRTEP